MPSQGSGHAFCCGRLRRLAAAVESSEDAIIGTDSNGIITDWNPGAEQVYGDS
jgi:PAS domain S-box-containing protein